MNMEEMRMGATKYQNENENGSWDWATRQEKSWNGLTLLNLNPILLESSRAKQLSSQIFLTLIRPQFWLVDSLHFVKNYER